MFVWDFLTGAGLSISTSAGGKGLPFVRSFVSLGSSTSWVRVGVLGELVLSLSKKARGEQREREWSGVERKEGQAEPRRPPLFKHTSRAHPPSPPLTDIQGPGYLHGISAQSLPGGPRRSGDNAR